MTRLPPDESDAPAGSGTVPRGSWATSQAARKSMRANRSRDTKPELAVRRAAHRLGLRYVVDVRPLPTLCRRADMVFTRCRVAVFIDGCWWHGCPDHYRAPAANAAYWGPKVARNRGRDAQTDQLLTAAGWQVIRIWEHEDAAGAARRIARVVRARRARRQDTVD